MKNEDVFARLYRVTGCRTQAELAELLDIRQSTISVAKRRGSVPSEWLLRLLRTKWINPDWVLTGLGPEKLGSVDEGGSTKIFYVAKIRPPKDCSSQELINELVRRALAEEDIWDR